MRTYLPRLGLALASLVLTLGLLEIAARLQADALFSTRHLVLASQKRGQVAHSQHDPTLGWIPAPGFRGRGAQQNWGHDAPPSPAPGTHADATITILEHGIRSNGREPPLEPRRIVSVGDSFTFGDRVSDGDTWPAYLERAIGVGVVNGGVYAYGLDQSVLRAEQLVQIFEPELVVLSFIRADIHRTMVSLRGAAAKPYFSVENGALALHNTPVPAPLRDLDPFRRLLGYSYLADFVMGRAAPAYWRQGPTKVIQKNPVEISCLLVQRLADLEHTEGTRVLLVAQQGRVGEFDTAKVDAVLGCARKAGLATLNLFPDFSRLAAAEPERYARLYENHMTAAGNAFVAARIAERIRSEAWLGRALP